MSDNTNYLEILKYAAGLPTGKFIKPKADMTALSGYSYPQLNEVLNKYSSYDSVLLKKLEDNGYLHGDFYDKILICPSCLAYNLCFREICPECHSSNLETVKMIHHFRCGYMGYESEFFKNKSLVCPKCSMELKYIGKDYETPTEIYDCLDCKWNGTEVLTSGHCLACDKEFLPENCLISNIKSYIISNHGKLALETGIITITEKWDYVELPSKEEINSHFSKIKPLLSLTNALGIIADRYKRPLLGISFYPDTFLTIHTPELKEELTPNDKIKLRMFLSSTESQHTSVSDIFSKMLLDEIKKCGRTMDFIAPLNNKGYFGIFPETDIEQGKLFAERVSNSVNAMRFGGTFKQTTLSIGIAAWSKSGDAIDLIHNSNKAMKKSIDSGGNAITVYGE